MPEKKHVHFVQSLEPLQGGGLGAAALQLHEAMAAASLHSRLISTRDEAFRVEWPGVQQFSRRGISKAFYAPDLRRASEGILAGRVHILHGHGFYVYTNYLFGSLARKRRIPLVYHVHGIFEPWILRRSRFKKQLAHWLFEDANFRHVRLWRALTNREADQIKAVVGSNANVVVAPNGIDLAPFSPRSEKSISRRRVLFLGRLHPKKGLDLLVQAWASLGPLKKDWELVIAGPDEGGYEAIVRGLVETAGISTEVSFTGPVSGSAKYQLLASADLFVLTSYSEGLPMAPLEAMASRVPVALTHECNLPEAAGDAGWSCPAASAAVTQMLREAMSVDDAERAQRGSAGRQLVERRFNWRNTVVSLQEASQLIV